jgi:hypothetical protein
MRMDGWGIYYVHGRLEVHTKSDLENLKGGDNLGGTGVYGRILYKTGSVRIT